MNPNAPVVINPQFPGVTITNFAESAGNVVTLTVTNNPYVVGDQVYLTGMTLSVNGPGMNNQAVTLTSPTNATTMTFADPLTQGAEGTVAETGTVYGLPYGLTSGLIIKGDAAVSPQLEIIAFGGSTVLTLTDQTLAGANGSTLALDAAASTFELSSPNSETIANGADFGTRGFKLHADAASSLQFSNLVTGSPLAATSQGTLWGMNAINFSTSGGANCLLDIAAVGNNTTLSLAPQLSGGGVLTTAYGFSALTAQGASIGTTTLFTIPNVSTSTGLWRMNYQLYTDGTGTGSVTVTFGWTNAANHAQTFTGASVSLASFANYDQGSVNFYALQNTPVTYSTTWASSGTYTLVMRPEFLG